ncbi:hypothetical protein FB451DRAFT_1445921 [Mycena latifolia]|nr:hypothetical protein FB451DRAFT_1445921 [Mycena latifolia]
MNNAFTRSLVLSPTFIFPQLQITTPTNLTMSEPQLQSFISDIFNPLFIGVTIPHISFGVIGGLTCRYFWCFGTKDSKLTLYLVGALFVLNTFEAGMIANVVLRASIVLSNIEYFENFVTWTLWAQPAVMAVIVFLVQLLFLKWCLKLTGNFSVLAFLPLLLLSLGCGLASSVSLFKVKPPVVSGFATPTLVPVWPLATSLLDMIILTVLTVALSRVRHSPDQVIESDLRVLTQITVSSLPVVFIGVLTDIIFYASPGTAYYLFPQFSISSIHTIAVLGALLSFRASAKTDCPSFSTSLVTVVKSPPLRRMIEAEISW